MAGRGRNKLRPERLHAEDRMLPAGRAAVERARTDGSWTLLDDVEDLVVPDDLAADLAARGAQSAWDLLTASTPKATLAWLVRARRSPGRPG